MIIIVAVLVSAFSFVQVGAKIPNRVPVQTVGTSQFACLACVMHIIMTIYFIISTLTLKPTFTSPRTYSPAQLDEPMGVDRPTRFRIGRGACSPIFQLSTVPQITG